MKLTITEQPLILAEEKRTTHLHIQSGAQVATDPIFTAAGQVPLSTGPNAAEAVNAYELLPFIFAEIFPEGTTIKFNNELSADGQYSGFVEDGLSSSALDFGKVLSQGSSGSWGYCNAGTSAAGADRRMGICLNTVLAAGAAIKVARPLTLIRADAALPTLTPGAPLFLSTTNGLLTQTAPSSSGNIVRIVGHAVDANTIEFNPSGDWYQRE